VGADAQVYITYIYNATRSYSRTAQQRLQHNHTRSRLYPLNSATTSTNSSSSHRAKIAHHAPLAPPHHSSAPATQSVPKQVQPTTARTPSSSPHAAEDLLSWLKSTAPATRSTLGKVQLHTNCTSTDALAATRNRRNLLISLYRESIDWARKGVVLGVFRRLDCGAKPLWLRIPGKYAGQWRHGGA